MNQFTHNCGESNHRFEPRYTESAQVVIPEHLVDSLDNAVDEGERLQDILPTLKTRMYVHDICVHCGKIAAPAH